MYITNFIILIVVSHCIGDQNKMANIYNSRLEYLYLVYSYLKLWIYDIIDYYHVYLILTLPWYLFGTPVMTITKELDSDDSDAEQTTNQYEVFINELTLVFYDKKRKATYRTLNGLQIRPILNEQGRFFITDISRYYFNLETIIIKYVKFDDIPSLHDDDNDGITKIIDVQKKYDIRNLVSCKMGVYL